jgi:large subunit ribosomal protein L5
MKDSANPMRGIKIEKVTLNVGCGEDAQKIERAKKLLEMLAGRKPVVTVSKRRSTFGMPKGKPIGAMVTLRGKKAGDVLKLALSGVENRLKASQFSDGNFSFGVSEYIEMEGVKYSHEIGTLGFDVSVTLARPGLRVEKRRIRTRRVSKKHKVSKDEAINWAKEKFGVSIIE